MGPKAYRSPTIASVDAKGYHYVANAPWWKDACVSLPCFSALEWPDYDTKIIEDTVDGHDVVIQLWKGWCQKFLGRDDFPGGIGAEVGIYRRLARKKSIVLPKEMPPFLGRLIQAGATWGTKDLWWPYPALKTNLTFDFVNPKTKETVFSDGPEVTYWLCKWMDEDSYRKYKARNKVPTWAAQYTLRFTVNGKSYTW